MPAFAARLAFGQMGDELLLASQHVEPAKLRQRDFVFQHSELKKALEEILKRMKGGHGFSRILGFKKNLAIRCESVKSVAAFY